MLPRAKLILINGPAGIGKTTIAKKYIDQHPLALCIEGDEIIANMGQWLQHEAAARTCVFELIKAMTTTHLQVGHDVIVPYLLTNATHAEAFEAIAKEQQADYFECILFASKEEATARLMQRGTWGEANAPPLTEKDRAVVEGLYDAMVQELEKRPHSSKISSVNGDIEDTYRQFLELLA